MRSRTIFRHLVVACLVLGAGAVGHAADKRPPKAPSSAGVDQCASVSGSVRMEAYGYTHVVTLRNGCEKPVICEAWTDVDPTPRQTLRAGPGETDEAITRRGSPAREVSAEASCRYE